MCYEMLTTKVNASVARRSRRAEAGHQDAAGGHSSRAVLRQREGGEGPWWRAGVAGSETSFYKHVRPPLKIRQGVTYRFGYGGKKRPSLYEEVFY